MVEKILTYALEKHDPGSAQDWRISSELWSPANGIFLGTLPPFLSFYDQQRELAFASQKFFSSIFSNIHLLFLQKGCSAHMSRSFSSIRLFRRSLSCNFPFQQSGIGKNVNVSNMPPLILRHVNEKNCFLNSRKDFISVFEKKGTVGAPECLSNISIYILCKLYKKACYMKHLPSHSPF